jgi:hypothetical protein
MPGVIKIVESYSWVDNSNAGKDALNSRYNVTGHNFTINVGGGRFAGNCLQLAGDGYFWQFYNGTMGPDFVLGFAVFYPSGVTGTNNATVNVFQTAAGNDEQVSLRMDPAGHITIRRGGVILATGLTVIQVNTWYYIEFAVHLDPAAGSASLYINGVLDATVAGVNTQPQATALVDMVLFTNFGNSRWCDVYGMDGTLVPLGPQRVSLKLATADGTNLDWTPSAGATQFNLVNTVPPNGDANGFISSNTPTNKTTLQFGALPYVPAVINAVQVGMYARFDDGGPHQIAACVVSGATTNVGAAKSIAATYLDVYLEIYQNDPHTAAPWTAAAVDAAQYGVDLVL